MKRHIFFMILVMVGNGAEAMEPDNKLRVAIQFYPTSQEALRLLQKGADPNEADWVDVPLSNAGSKKQVELMLSYGAEPKKMKESGLRQVISHYFSLKDRHKPVGVLDEQWRNEAFEVMDLLLKHGESIKKRGEGDVGRHVMSDIINSSLICDSDRGPLLSFLIVRGSNPNEVNLWYPDFSASDSIYAECQRNFPHLEKFMRKKRGWYLTWPLFLMTHFNKKTDEAGTEVWDYKQPSECAMRALPRDLVREIAKYLLHWKHGE